MPRALDELLRPSLTDDDDATGFHEPWDPSTLGWIMLLVGPFGGGWLMMRNQSRLGLAGGWKHLLAMAAVGVAVVTTVALLVPGFGEKSTEDARNARSIVRYAGNVVALPLAWVLLAEQRRRYRIAQKNDVPTGKLYGPGVAAFVVNLIIAFALAATVVAIKRT
ncbi:MAG TPA: hypothetical protein VF384_02410 [Planctomycetota bacterium]